ncbi:uncharacterized protein LOC113281240 [Papaver somniferum]|uniref:uncharacterized protein LOC113281240 n=1 Tax=Papaver somniferum TaxID=3469 RepID=UPI000E6F7703|nr:uncharacterized protein LOC113281240 [Papaver somniferum]XP_026385711.1 uncharacterized protein LOC113281240 [Papaver somniferum]
MAALISHIFSSSSLISLGLYHLICSTRNNLKSSPRDYIIKPYHPFPSSSPSASSNLKYLQLYLLIVSLLISCIHQTVNSLSPDPLLKGSTPVHRFTSLQNSAVLFLFLILIVSILISESTSLLPFPNDLFFAFAAGVFFLQYSVSSSSASVQVSDLQAKCDAVSARISGFMSLVCVGICVNPRLFVADVALGFGFCLQGLWALQTGLTLYVEGFIPEGCHRLLDVVSGVEGSTKCDLEESRLRAVAILDLVFVIHVLFVIVIVMVIYAVVAKTIGIRRFGSYEALPNLQSLDSNLNVQMKSISGTQA